MYLGRGLVCSDSRPPDQCTSHFGHGRRHHSLIGEPVVDYVSYAKHLFGSV